MSEKVLTGIIKSIKDDEQKFCLFTTDKSAYRDLQGRTWCKGDIGNLAEGMTVECRGEWEKHTFVFKKIKPVWISLQTTISYLINVTAPYGIRKMDITAICSKYGRKLFSTDKKELTDLMLSDFPEMDAEKVTVFVNALNLKDKALCELEDYLIPYGFKAEKVKEMYEFYGVNAMNKIKYDPYKACHIFDASFKIADQIAFDTKMEPLNKRRIAGLVREALKNAGNYGHTIAVPKDVANFVSYKSRQSVYRTEVPAVLVSYTVITDKEFILKDGYVSLYYLYKAEKDIAKGLIALKNVGPYSSISDTDIKRIEKELGTSYGKDQKKAFKMFETGGVNILTGGPGTGKTTTLNGIINHIKHINPNAVILLCAPTGRAAKRMSESTGMDAETIHKMCGLKPYKTEEFNDKQNVPPITADFVICDEFSMVSADLAATLINAMKRGTRFIIVGDEHQLPSIEPGNVLHDLIASGKFPVYRLEENFRQANGSSIQPNADRILAEQMPVNTKDFQIYKAKDEQDSYKALKYFMNMYYDKNDPYKAQLIEPSRKGAAGTFKMNRYMHNKLIFNDENGEDYVPKMGDKIIFSRTDYDEGYVNGDMGIITSLSDHVMNVNLEGYPLTISRKSMADVEFGYSYTIHKSQGSENPVIIIYLPEKMKHMMTNSLLYTAVTRARNTVIIIYEDDSLETCIHNKSDAIRNTRLLMFLSA